VASGEKRKEKGTGLPEEPFGTQTARKAGHYENRKLRSVRGAKQGIEERASMGIRVGVRGVG